MVRRVFMLPGLRRFGIKADSILGDLQERATILRSQRLVFFLNGFGLTLLTWASRYALVVAHCSSYCPRDRLYSSGFAFSCNDARRACNTYPRRSWRCRRLIRLTRWTTAASSLGLPRHAYLARAWVLCISCRRCVPNTGQGTAQP